MLAAVLGYRLPAFNRSTLSEILLAMSSASAAASVRYCASLCAAIAAPPIATSPSTPSEKIRIAISASIRKKPPCCPAGVEMFVVDFKITDAPQKQARLSPAGVNGSHKRTCPPAATTMRQQRIGPAGAH